MKVKELMLFPLHCCIWINYHFCLSFILNFSVELDLSEPFRNFNSWGLWNRPRERRTMWLGWHGVAADVGSTSLVAPLSTLTVWVILCDGIHRAAWCEYRCTVIWLGAFIPVHVKTGDSKVIIGYWIKYQIKQFIFPCIYFIYLIMLTAFSQTIYDWFWSVT